MMNSSSSYQARQQAYHERDSYMMERLLNRMNETRRLESSSPPTSTSSFTVQYFILTLSGVCLRINCTSSTSTQIRTVLQLKQQLLPLPYYSIDLLHAGRILQDHESILEYAWKPVNNNTSSTVSSASSLSGSQAKFFVAVWNQSNYDKKRDSMKYKIYRENLLDSNRPVALLNGDAPRCREQKLARINPQTSNSSAAVTTASSTTIAVGGKPSTSASTSTSSSSSRSEWNRMLSDKFDGATDRMRRAFFAPFSSTNTASSTTSAPSLARQRQLGDVSFRYAPFDYTVHDTTLFASTSTSTTTSTAASSSASASSSSFSSIIVASSSSNSTQPSLAAVSSTTASSTITLHPTRVVSRRSRYAFSIAHERHANLIPIPTHNASPTATSTSTTTTTSSASPSSSSSSSSSQSSSSTALVPRYKRMCTMPSDADVFMFSSPPSLTATPSSPSPSLSKLEPLPPLPNSAGATASCTEENQNLPPQLSKLPAHHIIDITARNILEGSVASGVASSSSTVSYSNNSASSRREQALRDYYASINSGRGGRYRTAIRRAPMSSSTNSATPTSTATFATFASSRPPRREIDYYRWARHHEPPRDAEDEFDLFMDLRRNSEIKRDDDVGDNPKFMPMPGRVKRENDDLVLEDIERMNKAIIDTRKMDELPSSINADLVNAANHEADEEEKNSLLSVDIDRLLESKHEENADTSRVKSAIRGNADGEGEAVLYIHEDHVHDDEVGDDSDDSYHGEHGEHHHTESDYDDSSDDMESNDDSSIDDDMAYEREHDDEHDHVMMVPETDEDDDHHDDSDEDQTDGLPPLSSSNAEGALSTVLSQGSVESEASVSVSSSPPSRSSKRVRIMDTNSNSSSNPPFSSSFASPSTAALSASDAEMGSLPLPAEFIGSIVSDDDPDTDADAASTTATAGSSVVCDNATNSSSDNNHSSIAGSSDVDVDADADSLSSQLSSPPCVSAPASSSSSSSSAVGNTPASGSLSASVSEQLRATLSAIRAQYMSSDSHANDDFAINEESMEQLTSMGFTRNASERSLYKFRNHVQRAVTWLLEHSADAGVNEPVSNNERDELLALSRSGSNSGNNAAAQSDNADRLENTLQEMLAVLQHSGVTHTEASTIISAELGMEVELPPFDYGDNSPLPEG